MIIWEPRLPDLVLKLAIFVQRNERIIKQKKSGILTSFLISQPLWNCVLEIKSFEL